MMPVADGPATIPASMSATIEGIRSRASAREKHGVDEQQLRRLGERAIVGILGKRNHVAPARRLMHQERALREQRHRFLPHEAGCDQTLSGFVDPDVSARIQLERSEDARAFHDGLDLAVEARRQPVVAIEADPQHRSGKVLRPLAVGLNRLFVLERLRRVGLLVCALVRCLTSFGGVALGRTIAQQRVG